MIAVVGMLETKIRLALRQFREAAKTRHFWIVVGMLALIAAFHFGTRPSPIAFITLFPLGRQTIFRILLILPIATAAIAFGRAGGLVTLGVALTLMMVRIVLLPLDTPEALAETLAVGAVGAVVVWMIETQERERQLRQKAVEELEIVNAITTTLSASLDLGKVLDQALAQVLEVTRVPAPSGGIFILRGRDNRLHLEAQCGLPTEFLEQERELEVVHSFRRRVTESDDVTLVDEAPVEAVMAACQRHGLGRHNVVPLTYQGRVLGALFLEMGDTYPPQPADRELFAALGRQIGAAVENARLYQNLRFFLGEVTRAQEDERKRVARELHDETAQGLIGLSRRLEDLVASEPSLSSTARQRLEELLERTDELARGVRRFCRALRPSVLDDLGLLPALESLLSELGGDGTQTHLEVRGDVRRLAPDTELVLYRTVQEALSNVRRHACASRVVVSVEYSAQRLQLAVHDDGCGFVVSDEMNQLVSEHKLGLTGMGERVKLLGGSLLLRSAPGEGTVVLMDVPA